MNAVTRNQMAHLRAHDGRGIAAAIWYALHHPDAAMRREISGQLSDWVESLGPSYSESTIRSALNSVVQQAIAPFAVERADLDAAVLVARILFSRAIAGTRVRIASRDAYAPMYGVTLTNNLKTTVTLRDIDKPRLEAGGHALLCPHHLPSLITQSEQLQAQLFFSGASLAIHVPWARLTERPQTSPRGVKLRVIDNGRASSAAVVKKLDLQCDMQADRVLLSTRSPEATMRLSALISEGVSFRVGFDDDAQDKESVYVRLSAASLDPAGATLATLRTRLPGDVAPWLSFNVDRLPWLPAPLRVWLATHVLPNPPWVDDDVADTLLGGAP